MGVFTLKHHQFFVFLLDLGPQALNQLQELFLVHALLVLRHLTELLVQLINLLFVQNDLGIYLFTFFYYLLAFLEK
jgi:hypothetical protein